MRERHVPGPMPVTSIKFDNIDTLRISDFLDSNDWKSKNISEFDNAIEHDNVGIFSFNHLEIEIDTKSELILNVPGHTYLIDINQSFFHSMFDNLGQYLAVKKYFPDIKPLALLGEFPYENNDYLNSKYKKYVLDLCDIDIDDIVHYPMFKKIVFEKVSFMTKSCNNILSGILEALSKTGLEAPMDIHWSEKTKQVYLIGRALKDFMLEHNSANNNQRYEKIFISRKGRSAVFQKNHDLIKFLMDNGVTWDLNNPLKINDPNGITKTNLDRFKPATPNDNLMEAQHRYMPASQETMIEDFFRYMGYTVVDVDNVPLPEQMELFSKCTHIATITGAGSLNSMYLDNAGTFVLIANNSEYTFYHEDLVSIMMDDPIIVFDKRKTSGKFSAKEIIAELEKNYLDRL